MAQSLIHRGPDADGLWSDSRAVLAHRRLAIIDLSDAGLQPMHSHSGRLHVVFNGEIFNHAELASLLESGGWRRRSHSDTEVLLEAIEAWGLDRFLELADGQFAFALYDSVVKRLSLVRDPFGEKPLVYAVSGDHIYFASEIRALERVSALQLEVDEGCLADYFRYGYLPTVATIYSGVKRVPAGAYVTFDLDRIDGEGKVERYWSPMEFLGESFAKELDQDHLESLLDESVRNRLVSDRPLGAFLSGGVDSSLTCAIAARHVSGALNTFTMSWEETEFDESNAARRVADLLGTRHQEVRLSRGDVVSAVASLGAVMDEPFADSSQLAVLLVSTCARRDVVVALSGDGGDELFAGYNRHRWLMTVSRYRAMFPARIAVMSGRSLHRLSPMAARLSRSVPLSVRPRQVEDKLQKLARAISADSTSAAYEATLSIQPSEGHPQRLPDALVSELCCGDESRVLRALRIADMTGYMPHDVLSKVDRATMAVSLESRTPFLHRGLAGFSLQLPKKALVDSVGGKAPLRRLLGDALPGVSFDAPKSGFAVPIASMLRGELSAAMADAIESYERRDLSVRPPFRQLLSRLKDGRDDAAAPLWSLLMFEKWADARLMTSR